MTPATQWRLIVMGMVLPALAAISKERLKALSASLFPASPANQAIVDVAIFFLLLGVLYGWAFVTRAALREMVAARGHDPNKLITLLELLVPKRIRDEDLGDALEVIDRLRAEGAPQWQLWLKFTTTVFWVGVNSIREVSSALLGQKAK